MKFDSNILLDVIDTQVLAVKWKENFLHIFINSDNFSWTHCILDIISKPFIDKSRLKSLHLWLHDNFIERAVILDIIAYLAILWQVFTSVDAWQL